MDSLAETSGGCHFLLQRIFDLRIEPYCLLALQADFLPLGHLGLVLTTDQNQKPRVTNVKETLASEESSEVESQPGIHQPSDSRQITEPLNTLQYHPSSCPLTVE